MTEYIDMAVSDTHCSLDMLRRELPGWSWTAYREPGEFLWTYRGSCATRCVTIRAASQLCNRYDGDEDAITVWAVTEYPSANRITMTSLTRFVFRERKTE